MQSLLKDTPRYQQGHRPHEPVGSLAKSQLREPENDNLMLPNSVSGDNKNRPRERRPEAEPPRSYIDLAPKMKTCETPERGENQKEEETGSVARSCHRRQPTKRDTTSHHEPPPEDPTHVGVVG